MSKFRTNKNNTERTATTNLAGGNAYKLNDKVELITILMNSFVNDQYYRSSDDTMDRVKTLLKRVDPVFAAKASLYARNELGMRSISHFVAASLAKENSGNSWLRPFLNKSVRRVDDMLEITAAFSGSQEEIKMSNAMKRAFADALGRFDTYQLSKYNNANSSFKLVDLVNLVHPRTTQKNGKVKVSAEDYWAAHSAKARRRKGIRKNSLPSELEISPFEALTLGLLKNTSTSQRALTSIGQSNSSSEEKAMMRSEYWKDIVNRKKIGYIDLIRSLNKVISESDDDTIKKAAAMIEDKGLIKRSLVMPYTIYIALKMVQQQNGYGKKSLSIQKALESALDFSVENVPNLEGETLVVVDRSGSMGAPVSSPNCSIMTRAEAGTLMGLILAKKTGADMRFFATTARNVQFNPLDSISTNMKKLMQNQNIGFGTNFHKAFGETKKSYARVIIFSDMQGWMDSSPGSVKKIWNSYKNRVNKKALLYSFDLAGYGSSQVPQKDVLTMGGFSTKIFDVMEFFERDKNALVKEIEKITF